VLVVKGKIAIRNGDRTSESAISPGDLSSALTVGRDRHGPCARSYRGRISARSVAAPVDQAASTLSTIVAPVTAALKALAATITARRRPI
jgi:hypothetical protein